MRSEMFAVADTLTARVSNVKKTIVPNVGHLPQMEDRKSSIASYSFF